MAFIQCQFFSETLGVDVSMNVIVPQKRGAKLPTLYLLHGMSDDHTKWSRQTSIERYASERGLAVVMPAVNRSYYADMARGPKYWTFISEEVPEIAESLFPLSDRREDRFVAGLSMGGYGAFKLGLRCPDRFAAAASLSGALDVARIAALGGNAGEMGLIFADPTAVAGTDDDLFALAERAANNPSAWPKLFQCCGTEDFLYADNTAFRDHCRRIGLPVEYEEGPGAHVWEYWDVNIRRIVDWLPVRQ